MEFDIYNDEQREYLNNNLEESSTITRLMKGLEDLINTHPEMGSTLSENLSYLYEKQQVVKKNLEPFIDRNNQFNQRKEQIIKKNGFNPDDMYDERTISDIIALKAEMKNEVSGMSNDLRSKKVSNSELDSMFETTKYTTSENLEKQFK